MQDEGKMGGLDVGLESDGIVNGVAKEPSQKQITEWLLDVNKYIQGGWGEIY